ncbi:pH-response regulator protein palH/rim21 [Puttea exsequens]|nr:pH-response regulator protein palH/rim21 [Puttea exsequens]
MRRPELPLSPRILITVPTSTRLAARQIWIDASLTSGSLPHTCTPFRLPSGGEINIGGGTILTLTQDAGFQPQCGSTPVPQPVDPLQPGADLSVLDYQDPFYASTSPQLYAISAVTIVSYMLVIILFITPRTFFVAGGGTSYIGQRGVMSGAYGSNSVIGIGSRPWLQKLAALTVAISLTIVTADTFTWAERQYNSGYQDSMELTMRVITSLEIRIVRTISETLLWLAQAQTLIRLFPRHKEKLLIKWIAFALIVLELIFSSLNHFLVENEMPHPKRFMDAIPAMNYLFALTLNLCYGGFIVFYALQKRRFAFYHTNMRNMPLVALLSLTAVLIPVVFFVLDLSKPNIAGWGSYVRWVGAAAASVVVWEWVERIEALERDEKKDGILGREIFDGDEMLDATPSSDNAWPSARRKPGHDISDRGFGVSLTTGWHNISARARRMGRSRHDKSSRSSDGTDDSIVLTPTTKPSTARMPEHARNRGSLPAPPQPVASPISRTDTRSAASTVYRVRYHPTSEPTPPIMEDIEPGQEGHCQQQQQQQQIGQNDRDEDRQGRMGVLARKTLVQGLQRFPNPFRRQRETPPPEVVRALAENGQQPPQISHGHPMSLLQRLHLKKPDNAPEAPRPVIMIPAKPVRRRPANDSDNYEMSARDDGNGLTDHTESAPSSARDPDQPPDAVLDALRNSQSLSPNLEHAQAAAGCAFVQFELPVVSPTPTPAETRDEPTNPRPIDGPGATTQHDLVNSSTDSASADDLQRG